MRAYTLILAITIFLTPLLKAQHLINNQNAKENEASLVGIVTDLNKVPEEDLSVTIVSGDKTYKKVCTTDLDGKFQIIVPKGKKYHVSATKMGMEFSFVSDVPNVKGPLEVVQNYVITYLMTFSRTYHLHNVFFDTNKWDIKEVSFPALDSLANTFKQNAMFMAEIAGYTDNVGNDVDNMRLSQHRADAIRTYLISKGVEPGRILAKGYGELFPIATNDTEEGRALNRRTDVKVMFE